MKIFKDRLKENAELVKGLDELTQLQAERRYQTERRYQDEQSLKSSPLDFLLSYYGLVSMELFEIENMADSPYHINCAGSLCNNEGKIRDEMYQVLLNEPNRFKRCRKMNK